MIFLTSRIQDEDEEILYSPPHLSYFSSFSFYSSYSSRWRPPAKSRMRKIRRRRSSILRLISIPLSIFHPPSFPEILPSKSFLDGVDLQDPGGGGGDPVQGEGITALPLRPHPCTNCLPPSSQYFQVIFNFISMVQDIKFPEFNKQTNSKVFSYVSTIPKVWR